MQFGCFDGGFALGKPLPGPEDRTGTREENGDVYSKPLPPPPKTGAGSGPGLGLGPGPGAPPVK